MKINRKNKIYSNNKGSYIIFNNKRLYLNNYIYCTSENAIYINISNCLTYKFYDIEFIYDIDNYIKYKIEKIIL